MLPKTRMTEDYVGELNEKILAKASSLKAKKLGRLPPPGPRRRKYCHGENDLTLQVLDFPVVVTRLLDNWY